MAGDTYSKFLDLLHKGEGLTYRESKSMLGVGPKQLYLYVQRAEKEGIPIRETKVKRVKTFTIPDEHRRPGFRVELTPDELLALTIAADSAQTSLNATSLGPPLRAGIRKLVELFPDRMLAMEIEESDMRWHFSSTPVAEVDPAVFHKLMDAIRNDRQIVVAYRSATSGASNPNRILDPYLMALRGSSWLLVAWCHTRRTFRDFSVPAISNVRQTGKDVFRRDFDPETHFRERFGATGGAPRTVRLRIEPDRIPWFHRKKYHPSQRLIPQDDGTMIVEYDVAGLEDIRSFAQSWGNGITVLEPEELVNIMRAHATELAERYRAPEASPANRKQ